MYFSTLLSGAALFHLTIAGYVLEDDYMKDFFGNFDFFSEADPTQGFVQYVDQSTAQDMGLINSSATGAVSWGVDSTNKTPEGRPSVRLSSKKTYNNGLVVLDVEHMPVGCGTWPAFWMVGPDWPVNGEIDILEGVNEQDVNAMTLHTGPGCSISAAQGAFTGSVETDNCDVDAPDQLDNAGCSISHPSKQSYGTGLNANKGGVYATLWTDAAISVYFFPRGEVPEGVLGESPDPAAWGPPAAKFAGACDIASIFKEQQIVFSTTFCGAWAGAVWEEGSCASKAPTCDEYVRDNPEDFAEAFWTINSLRVYQDNGEKSPAEEPAQPSSSSSAAPISSAVATETSSQTPIETPVGTPTQTPNETPTETPVESSVATSASTSNAQLQTPSSIPVTSTPSPLSPSAAPIPGPTNNTTSALTPLEPTAALPTTASTLPTAISPPAFGNSTTLSPGGSATSIIRSPSPTTSQGQNAPVPVPTAPVREGPMGGFQWPVGGGGGGEEPADSTTASLFESTVAATSLLPSSTAVASSGTLVATTTTILTVSAPSASKTTTPQEEDLAIPIPTGANVIQTVYETVFVTAPAAAETPAPAPAGLRRDRHVRDHRRRITKHNARQ